MGTRRRIVAGLVAFASAFAGLASTQDTAGAATCGSALVVGVRGSGETKSDYGGYGRTVYATINSFREANGVGFDAVPLDYPSKSVTALIGRPANYFKGVDEGIANLRLLLGSRAQSCPTQPIVLIGYSQGALVVNRALVELGEQSSPILQRITSVELIADPQRIGIASYTIGTAPSALNGVSYALGQYPAEDIPATIRTRTDSICNEDDLVCAFGGITRNTAPHKQYATNGWAEAAGVRAANRVQAFTGTPFTGTTQTAFGAGGCDFVQQVFDFSYSNDPVYGAGTVHIVGCVALTPLGSFEGTFTATTTILNGTASGSAAGMIDAEAGGPGVPAPFELTLTPNIGGGGYPSVLMTGLWYSTFSGPGPVEPIDGTLVAL